jgi:hypothetical protein
MVIVGVRVDWKVLVHGLARLAGAGSRVTETEK